MYDSNKIFLQRKKVIRTMVGAWKSVSFRELHRKFHIVRLGRKCMPALVRFMIRNLEIFESNRGSCIKYEAQTCFS
jgi:hypothetical protein